MSKKQALVVFGLATLLWNILYISLDYRLPVLGITYVEGGAAAGIVGFIDFAFIWTLFFVLRQPRKK